MMFLSAHTRRKSSSRCLIAAALLLVAGSLLHTSVSAQDSLRLQSFGPHSIYSKPIVRSAAPTFVLASGGRGTSVGPDTAALNARYRPERNPLLIWKNDYPLTEEQIQDRERQYRMQNDLRKKIPSELIQSMFSRKKLKPVKPTF